MADVVSGREVEEAIEAGHTSNSNCCQSYYSLSLVFNQ